MQSTKKGDTADVVVTVSWGTYALAAKRVERGESFALGEGGFLPLSSSTLGAERVEYVRVTPTGRVLLALPTELEGRVHLEGSDVDLASFVDEWRVVHGQRSRPREVELPVGAVVDLALAGSLFRLRIEVAGPESAIPHGVVRQLDPWAFAMTALSLALHGALVSVFVLTRHGLEADAVDTLERDQILFMRAMLEASAEREIERQKPADEEVASPPGGGSSEAARGLSGRSGSSVSRATKGRLTVAALRDNPDPHLPAEQLLREVAEFGLAGILNLEARSDGRVALPWERGSSALGRDAASTNGSLFDPESGDAFGGDGLGVAGSALGGGGDGTFVGLDRLHGLDVAATGGSTKGIGGRGVGGRDGPAGHRPRSPGLRAAAVETNGRLPADVIQRILRQQSGRLRFCYEAGLTKNPNLEGRVVVRFVIDRAGAVAVASDAGSDLPDASVVGCVVRVISALTFSAPPDGIVTVTYPVVFSPGL